MQADDPPYLSVGTAVSAKYKGAFCEAKVSKVVRIVKCKVTYKMGLGTATVSDEQIKGTLRVGQLVQAKHPEKKEFVDATITKIQDCSQYTVVFDDGDITTLRRTALCLKSGRHFNESETLDQLPLTHPEHFGNPVVGGRRGRRNRQLNYCREDSSEEEVEEENEPDLEGYSVDIGRVVSIEATDKKRTKDNWFPGLVVIPSAQPTVRINVKDEYLVRSFKDGRYYTVPKKEVSQFTREMGEKVESPVLAEAVHKALKFLDTDELPVHWERTSLFNLQSLDSDSEENYSDSSDDGPSEEKDLFVAQLYKFMEDSRTPLNSSPTIAKRDVDLHRLFRVVEKFGGYNRVTNQNKWRAVALRLKFPNTQNIFNQVKHVYKTCLLSYESFYRTLGVTMHVNTRSTKKNRGRSLIRDKDRNTPVNVSRTDKDDEIIEKREEKEDKPVVEEAPKKKIEPKKELEKKKKELVEVSDNNSSSDATDQSEPIGLTVPESGRPKRNENKVVKEKKLKVVKGEKVKSIIEHFEEQAKKEDDKAQVTRSKSLAPKIQIKDIPKDSAKETVRDVPSPEKKKEPKSPVPEVLKPSTSTKVLKKTNEEEKKRGRKRLNPEDKASASDSSTTDLIASPAVNKGDKLKVYYGPTHESKVTYEAKVIEIDGDSAEPMFLVHYTGWNTRYDEWISLGRIAENLSATTKAKRLKQSSSLLQNASKSASSLPRVAGKRGRGISITGRSTISEAPRSTTPSSVTSSSSRTKSPTTPVARVVGRPSTRKDLNKRTRRASLQTDLSVHSESELEVSECEIEITRTRSVSKNEQEFAKSKTIIAKKLIEKQETEKDDEIDRTKRTRKIRKFLVDIKSKSDDDDTEKEEEERERPKRIRKIKKFHDDEYDSDKEEEIEKRKRTRKLLKKSEDDTEREEEPEKIRRYVRKIKKSEDEEDTEDTEILPKRVRKTKKSEGDFDSDLDEESEIVKRPLRKIKKSEDDDTEKEEDCERPKRKRKTRKIDEDNVLKEEQDVKVKKGKKPAEKVVTDSDEDSTNPPKGRDFDLNQIRSELKGLKIPSIEPDLELAMSDEFTEPSNMAPDDEDDLQKIKREAPSVEKSPSSEDVYEFKEPEPFEFESRKLLIVDDKSSKKRIPRLFDDLEKSPKKNKIKVEKLDEKETPPEDKKWFNKTPVKKQSDAERGEADVKVDAFDKLVESPSYNIIKTISVQQQQRVKKFFEEPLSLLNELSEPVEDYTTDRLGLSDNDESQGQPIFTRGDELFSDAFSKSPSATGLVLDFNKPEEPKTKDSDEEEVLRESIKRIAEATCTDEDSNDTLRITPPTTSSYSAKKKEPEVIVAVKPSETSLSSILGLSKELEVVESAPVVESKMEVSAALVASPLKQISPALQESDSSILESIVSTKPILLNLSLDDAPKELNVSKDLNLKTGTKIADTILQKINSVKNNKPDAECEKLKPDSETEIETEELKLKPSTKLLNPKVPPETKLKPAETQGELKGKKPSSPAKFEHVPELKKRRKVVSRPYIDESDSDSSDSEQLIIARSDEESQTNSVGNKPDVKGSDSDNTSLAQDVTDDSRSQEEARNFKFGDVRKEESLGSEAAKDEALPASSKTAKAEEEEPDSQLHNLLICEETIPRSPGPSNECSSSTVESKNKTKSVLEMPFASAPSSSNNKSILLAAGDKPVNKPQTPPLLPLVNRSNRDVSTVLDNTPPMTPESTISLSPRGDNEGLSPNAADNESGKSNETDADFSRKLAQSSKVSPYSEEDTQTGDSQPAKKLREDVPASCKKRRRSTRTVDDVAPAKRGRKPLNRSRHNSDSDDTSEHSISGSTCITSSFDRTSRSPRPSKYNFFVEFDPSLDSGQRIAVLTQKLSDLRKTYADVKAELATVERRRKKLRRREREALKTAKQEVTCA